MSGLRARASQRGEQRRDGRLAEGKEYYGNIGEPYGEEAQQEAHQAEPLTQDDLV